MQEISIKKKLNWPSKYTMASFYFLIIENMLNKYNVMIDFYKNYSTICIYVSILNH